MQETRVRSLEKDDPLKKEMATRSSILAWEIPWTEKPDALQSMGVTKSRTRRSDQTTMFSLYATFISVCILLNYPYIFKCELF